MLPDLNYLNYRIWGVMQQRVCEVQIHNVDELKQRLVDKCCQRCCQQAEKAFAELFTRREDTSNICCRLIR